MILVTGGTGFVGSHLVPHLLKREDKIRCLVRSSSKAGTLRDQGVELVVGDVADPQSLREAMQDVKIVIHLVAVIRESKGATFNGVNTQGTRNVVEAAQESGVKRFIHMSTLGASSNPRYRYTYSKWQGEEAVRSSNMDWVIFRPSVMFGQGFGFINRLIRSLTMFPIVAPVPGSGKARFQPIWVEDTVSCIIEALNTGKTGQIYEIGGPEHLAYDEMLDTIMHALRIRRIKVHIPLPLMRFLVAVMEKAMPDPPVTSVELAQLDLDNTTKLDSVKRHFGFKPLALSQGLGYIKRLYQVVGENNEKGFR